MRLLAALCLFSSCASRGPTDVEAAERAEAALAPFKKSLKQALLEELGKSTVSAVEVCATRAPELARKASVDGVRIGRSSEKLRNPGNAPPAWLVPVMDDLARAPAETTATRVVDLGDGKRGYAESIRIEPPCLLCHGATIAPDVAAKISERYPDDRARGYELGDFRGVFWVELDPMAH